jgi:hypothetical protein
MRTSLTLDARPVRLTMHVGLTNLGAWLSIGRHHAQVGLQLVIGGLYLFLDMPW